jgi:ammonia channel protein AmtB
MLWIINKVTSVKLSKQEEEIGLDEILHGERAYTDAM